MERLTSRVKMPITGLWSLMLYSMLLVYRSWWTFRRYSSSSFSCFLSLTSFPSCSSSGGDLGLARHRIRSVQAGFRFLPLDRWSQIICGWKVSVWQGKKCFTEQYLHFCSHLILLEPQTLMSWLRFYVKKSKFRGAKLYKKNNCLYCPSQTFDLCQGYRCLKQCGNIFFLHYPASNNPGNYFNTTANMFVAATRV